ncbi:MAG: IS1634 family transposase, partial [Acidimicrobiales bacterium]
MLAVFHRAYDGGTGEVAQVVPAMEELKKLAGERRFLVVGDSKLVSYTNLAAMAQAKVDFIAPASKTYVDAATLAAQDLATATPVDYVAERDRDKRPEDRGSYKVAEDTMVLAGPPKADPELVLRRV